jgi:hypothetical protein
MGTSTGFAKIIKAGIRKTGTNGPREQGIGNREQGTRRELIFFRGKAKRNYLSMR